MATGLATEGLQGRQAVEARQVLDGLARDRLRGEEVGPDADGGLRLVVVLRLAVGVVLAVLSRGSGLE